MHRPAAKTRSRRYEVSTWQRRSARLEKLPWLHQVSAHFFFFFSPKYFKGDVENLFALSDLDSASRSERSQTRCCLSPSQPVSVFLLFISGWRISTVQKTYVSLLHGVWCRRLIACRRAARDTHYKLLSDSKRRRNFDVGLVGFQSQKRWRSDDTEKYFISLNTDDFSLSNLHSRSPVKSLQEYFIHNE